MVGVTTTALGVRGQRFAKASGGRANPSAGMTSLLAGVTSLLQRLGFADLEAVVEAELVARQETFTARQSAQ